MTIKALYPNIRPSLDLNFARTKALDPRITFTRASTGTFVGSDGCIKNVANGAARFDHDPVTGESLGFLVEEARTNRIWPSENIVINVGGGQTWTHDGTGILIANAVTVAPNNIVSAAKIYKPNAVSASYLRMAPASVPSTLDTISIYLKAAELASVDIRFTSIGYATINLSTGTTNAGSLQRLPNGWHRFSYTPTSAPGDVRIYPGSVAATGDGASGIFVWGGQIEAGSVASSYIPTTTATVTRAADVADITGTNFTNYFNQTEGTYFVEASRPTGNQVGNGIQLFTGFIGAFDNSSYFTWRYQGTNSIVWSTVDNGSYREMYVDTGAATNIKIVGTYKSGSNAVAWNGAIRATDNRTSASGDTGFYLNRDRFGSATLVSQIKRIAYYPTRLSDTQLVSLSQ